MEEEDDDLTPGEEQPDQLSSSIRRYEEMMRKKEHYFFDVDVLIRIIDHFTETLEFQKALDVTKYAHTLHPHSISFTLKEAHLFALLGREEEALQLLDKVERINPFDIDIYLIRGNVYNSLEQYPRAIACFKKALELADGQKDDIWLSLAITSQNMGDFSKAVDYYEKCLTENPTNEVAMEEMITSLEFSRRLDDGITFFNKLIDDDPYGYMLWYYLGDIYGKKGLHEKAIQAYEYCLLIREDFAPAHLDMAHSLSMLEKFREAIDRYKQAFEYCQPDAFTYYNLGECHEQLREFEEARTYYKKAVKMNPEMAQAWYGIGVTCEEEERWYEAIHYIKKAIEIDDQNGDYLLALGDCEYQLGNHAEAEEYYKKVVDFDPVNPEGWMALGELQHETHRLDEAIETINAGLIYHPTVAELHYRLCCYLYLSGQLEEAYVELQIALDSDPSLSHIIFEIVPGMENDARVQMMLSTKR